MEGRREHENRKGNPDPEERQQNTLEESFPGHASVKVHGVKVHGQPAEDAQMFLDGFDGNASDGSMAIRNGFGSECPLSCVSPEHTDFLY